MSDARPGLRERKNQRTRRAIIEATLQLTLEQGFEATTIAAIAERADVAPRTVFAWFGSKEDIVLGHADENLQRLMDAVARDDGQVLDRIEAWLDGEAKRSQDDDDIHRERHRVVASDPYLRARERERLTASEEAIAVAVARELGLPADELGPRAFAAAVISVLLLLRQRYIVEPDTATARDGRADGLAFLRGGITGLRTAVEATRS
jgi:AcrR family transcriptional regulator